MKNNVQLITYPDSLAGGLKNLDEVLSTYFDGLFSGLHILPFFPSAGDRGFSPLTYFEVEPSFGEWSDIKKLGEKYDILADIMVNHISSQSHYVKDYLQNGDVSAYKDFFITMDKIWQDGEINQQDINKMFLRRIAPYSTYESEAYGKKVLWTTFGKKTPSEQVDLDIYSPAVEKLFEGIFAHLASNNINMIRLDAVGYVIKKLGTSCFFVEPEIWDFMKKISSIAESHNILLLPEVHSHYSMQYKLAENGFWIYDFILPYRIMETVLTRDATELVSYIKTRPTNQFTMIDCHDGIPVKPDLDDLVTVEQAKKVVDICVSRGSTVSKVLSDAHKGEDGFDVHQIRGTIYSILDKNDDVYIMARAIQLFVPGIPQVYYVGLLAGENDYKKVKETGEEREINRHNFTKQEIETQLENPVVKRLLSLIKFRNNYPVFDGNFEIKQVDKNNINFCFTKGELKAELNININTNKVTLNYIEGNENRAIEI
jgi:sucrose phosphorylase